MVGSGLPALCGCGVQSWANAIDLKSEPVGDGALLETGFLAGLPDPQIAFAPQPLPRGASAGRSLGSSSTRGRYELSSFDGTSPSTRGIVNVTQDVRLKLQILQSMPNHIADADDTGQLAAA